MKSELDDRERWRERYAHDSAGTREPSAWIMEACSRLAAGLTVVDLAAGNGRHAVPLSRAGRQVIALDFVEDAIRSAVLGPGPDPAAIRDDSSRSVHGIVADVWHLPIRRDSVDVLLVTNFLERDLFPTLAALLRPGGFLVYETYIDRHRELVDRGIARAPRSPRYLLNPAELTEIVRPLTILDHREGHVIDRAGERYVASVVAQDPR